MKVAELKPPCSRSLLTVNKFINLVLITPDNSMLNLLIVAVLPLLIDLPTFLWLSLSLEENSLSNLLLKLLPTIPLLLLGVSENFIFYPPMDMMIPRLFSLNSIMILTSMFLNGKLTSMPEFLLVVLNFSEVTMLLDLVPLLLENSLVSLLTLSWLYLLMLTSLTLLMQMIHLLSMLMVRLLMNIKKFSPKQALISVVVLLMIMSITN